MPGRKRTPTVIKKQDGNPGRRPIPADEPDPVVGLPECPPHLDDEARAEWDRLGAQLVKENRMALVYKAAFAAYCMAWSRWVKGETALQEFGMVITTPNGHLQPSPYVSITRQAWDQMVKALSEMGLSPTSQARAATVTPAATVSPLQAFLVRGGKR